MKAVSSTPQQGIESQARLRASGGLGTAAMWTGISSLLVWPVAWLVGPVAFVLGIVAGAKTRFDVRAIAGVASGALSSVLVAIWVFLLGSGAVDLSQLTQQLQNGLDGVSQEAAFAESSSQQLGTTEDPDTQGSSAYAQWAASFEPHGEFDGMYDGADLVTPCYSFAGQVWWVTSGDAATCDGASELWWQAKDGQDQSKVELFGAGAVGAAVVVEAIADTDLEQVGVAASLDGLVDFVVHTLLPESGVKPADVVETSIAGTRAVAIEVDTLTPGYGGYRMYALQAPAPYVQAQGAEFFLVRVYSASNEVYPFVDATDRFESTFEWR